MTEIQWKFSALGSQGREFSVFLGVSWRWVVGAGQSVAFDIHIQGWMQGVRSKDLVFLLGTRQNQCSLHHLRTVRL